MNNESLLQVFEPPEGYVGQVCICCALSADQLFMEEALSRFSKRYDGTPSIFLMLDKTQHMLNASQMPGLVQLQAKNDKNIRIQHAKVALMQFGKAHCTTKLKLTTDTVWRLAVSTGNWTKESACQNIEMVWKADFFTKDAKINRQLLMDLFSACDFFMELRESYVCNKNLWTRAELLSKCLNQYKEERGIKRMGFSPRFISTIKGNPLIKTIECQFKKDDIRRNFIQIGSGFYEKETDSSKPVIIKALDDLLKNCGKPKKKKIVVNTTSAYRLAYWDKGSWDGWELFDIKDPVKDDNCMRNFLHAKYICLGSINKDKLKNSKFYIGSGNLTKMGLLSAYGMNSCNHKGAGNVEAGVIIDVEPQTAKKLLTHGKPIKNPDVLEKKEEKEEPQKIIPVCPLNAFELENNLLKPIWNACDVIENINIPCTIITDCEKKDLLPFNEQTIPYPTTYPIYILTNWNGFEYWIPVITKNGTLPLPIIKLNSIDDLLESIAEFPDRQDLEDVEKDPNEVTQKITQTNSSFNDDIHQDVFPIQLSMKLVEGIAKRNESITDDLVDDWIDTLERYLDALPPESINELRKMKVNFLSVLTVKGFAPPLEKERSNWNKFIKRMSEKWGMSKWIGLK